MKEAVSKYCEAEIQEYICGASHVRHFDNLRRQDIALCTGAQIAIFTIIGKNIFCMTWFHYILSVMAIFVLFLGLNSDRRTYHSYSLYFDRLKKIETKYLMSLYNQVGEYALEIKWYHRSVSNKILFPLYYLLFMIVWLSVLAKNLFS